jgi:hypothetical protein
MSGFGVFHYPHWGYSGMNRARDKLSYDKGKLIKKYLVSVTVRSKGIVTLFLFVEFYVYRHLLCEHTAYKSGRAPSLLPFPQKRKTGGAL